MNSRWGIYALCLFFCAVLVVGVREFTFRESVFYRAFVREAFVPKGDPLPTIRVLTVGDMFFDRYIRKMGLKHGEDFLFSCIKPLLQKADIVVGNLEGPITANRSVSMDSVIGSPENYRFTFPTTTAALLARHGISAVSLGNNHIGNFGVEGLYSTRVTLDARGVGHFGGLAGDEPVFRTEAGGILLSFLSYNEFGGVSPETVGKKIALERREGRKVIVFAHWGNEYDLDPAPLRERAALFAENGADIIIGAHPHVVLPHERIGHTEVYYSLGNFIFDQYMDAAVRRGLAVLFTISGTSTSAEEYPVWLESDGRTCPAQAS